MREEMLYALQIKPPVWPMSGMIMEGSLHIGQMKREKKSPVRSICVGENGGAPSIYKDKQSADDENGLPVYYKNGEPVWKEERWVTGESTGPDGKEEGMDEAHVIARLPFGAYILQEEGVPFEQGYVQAPYQGLILEDRKGPQKYFHQDEFTKAAFAKIDIRTQKEIKGAEMTLYRALLDKNGRPETEENGIYKKGEPGPPGSADMRMMIKA